MPPFVRLQQKICVDPFCFRMRVSVSDIYRCCEDLVTREIVGETIIVPISGKLANMQQIYTLNDTGDYVWKRFDGQTTLQSIRDGITEEFDIDGDTAWKDLEELVTDLVAAELIEKVA
jgi:hypothetical protein